MQNPFLTISFILAQYSSDMSILYLILKITQSSDVDTSIISVIRKVIY